MMMKYCIGVAIVLLTASFNPVRSQMVEDYEDFSYDGFLEAEHDVMLSAVEIGRLAAVHFKLGDRVEEGQEVATLENGSESIALEIAKYQVEMKGDLDAAVAERNLNLTRVEQLRILTAMGTARPDELARAETDLLVADARIRIVMEEQQNRALEVQRHQVQLDRRRVISPISGVVAKILHQPGEYISPGDSAIMRVISKDSLIAVFNLPATDAMQLTAGQRVAIRPRSVPRLVDGVVESMSPAIDGESGTVAVRIKVGNRDESLLPGDRCQLANVRQLTNTSRGGRQPLMLRQFNR